jgi:hypothetical protein
MSEPAQQQAQRKPVEQMDQTELWWWLYNHPSYVAAWRDCLDFWHALDHLDIDWVHVNPETETIEDDKSLNTAARCWLEFGPLWFPEGDTEKEPRRSWDERLNSGGACFEEAFRELCLNVLAQDGDYEEGWAD